MTDRPIPGLKKLSELTGARDDIENDRGSESAADRDPPENRLDPDERECLKAATRILAYGDRSERQMRERLTDKGFGPVEIAEVLEILREKRWLDDLRFMENAARGIARTKLCGRGRIRMELMQKVDRETVEIHFDEVMESLSDLDFTAIARKRAAKHAGKSREYLAADLKKNGFTREEIIAALA